MLKIFQSRFGKLPQIMTLWLNFISEKLQAINMLELGLESILISLCAHFIFSCKAWLFK